MTIPDKMKGKNKKPEKHGKFYETLIDFGENTSFHGVKYIFSSESSIYERIFWVIVVVSGICGATYMTMIFWNRFTSNPIRISIQPIKKQTSIIPFPSVTICTGIRFLPEKVENFVNSLELPDNTSAKAVQDSFKALMGYVHQVNVDPQDIALLNEVLLLNNYFDNKTIDDVFSQIEPNCEDILIKCRWEQKIEPCQNIFKSALTSDGTCCSFNINDGTKEFQAIHTLFYGPQMGLSIIVNPRTSSFTDDYSMMSSTGIKILLNEPDDYPGFASIETNVANGTETFIRVLGTSLVSSESVKSLTPEQRSCLFEEERKLEYFPVYKDSDCDVECRINDSYHFCKCVPYTYPNTDKRICGIDDIICLSTNFNAIFRKMTSNNVNSTKAQCECQAQCNDVFYSIQTTSIPTNYDVPTLSNFYNVDKKYEDIKDRMVIHLYFGSFHQTEMLRDTITSYYYLLSSFGGVFSLFLGCSFLSILEIVYFFCYRLFIK